jgi:hypothetical protein
MEGDDPAVRALRADLTKAAVAWKRSKSDYYKILSGDEGALTGFLFSLFCRPEQGLYGCGD